MGSNMAENHPVGFQWVMEAKRRGAKPFHVDPRFTRTSAMADRHVLVRAGSDIAFLGGVIRYILEHERYFREYVVAYTNAATIVSEEFQDTEDLGGVFSGFEPQTSSYDTSTWGYAGTSMSAAAGQREVDRVGQAARRPRRRARAWRGARARRDAPASALRLSAAQAALRPLHAGVRRGDVPHAQGEVPRGLRGAVRELGPGAHVGVLLRGRMDAAHGRRAVHPRRVDHPAAARQHRATRRWDPRAARPRDDPGLHRHPDPVRHPARLPAHAARARALEPGRLHRTQRGAARLLGQRARLHGVAAEGLLGRRGNAGQRLASTICRGSRATIRSIRRCRT
jgi:hypothetical protein